MAYRSNSSSGGSGQYAVLSPWAYFGWGVLFHLPFIGWIIAAIIAFGNSNINRRNYARAFFVMLLLYFIVWLIISLTNWNLSWLNFLFF